MIKAVVATINTLKSNKGWNGYNTQSQHPKFYNQPRHLFKIENQYLLSNASTLQKHNYSQAHQYYHISTFLNFNSK